MRSALAFCIAYLLASPALAAAIPFYGPKQGVFGEGYKHSLEKDGSWRIVTEYLARDPLIALDVALYRAAELARDGGHPYVEILSGYGMSGPGVSSGFVFARASDSPAPPRACRDKRCYTADVSKVLDILSGPTGDQPGVAKASSIDQFGRQVFVSGFGTGAIAWTQR